MHQTADAPHVGRLVILTFNHDDFWSSIPPGANMDREQSFLVLSSGVIILQDLRHFRLEAIRSFLYYSSYNLGIEILLVLELHG